MPTLKKPVSHESENLVLSDFLKVFPVRKKPDGELPLMPKSLSSLESSKLSDLYAHYAGWREFSEDITNVALAEMVKAKQAYDYAWDVEFLKVRSKFKTSKETDAYLHTHAELESLKDIWNEKELFHTLLLKKLESLNNALTVISREITRRGISEPR